MFGKGASAALACVLALAGCSERTTAARQASGSCGPAQAPKALMEASRLVKTDTPLYWVNDEGQLLVGGFDGRTPRVLHQRPFDKAPNVYVSPDRRWMLYGGWMQDHGTTELWLFDTRTERTTKVFDGPAFLLRTPAFSPDGRSAAFFNEYDHRWPTAQIGLYLIDTERGQTDFIGPVEGSAIAPNQMIASPEWSAKGDRILFLAGGNDIREYHAFSPATRKFRRIDGDVDAKGRKTEYFENGVKIPVLEQASTHARVMYYERASPDGSLMARINEKYELVVTGAGRNSITIDTGEFSDCEGVTIVIVDWVDQNKYLVYYVSGTIYIAEPTTGRRAQLFALGAPVRDFTW